MSWSYNLNLSTDKDKVRFAIGDTSESCQMLSDEEIQACLVNSNIYKASVRCLRSLIARYSYKTSETVGRISISYANTVKSLEATLNNILMEQVAELGGGAIYTGYDRDNIFTITEVSKVDE